MGLKGDLLIKVAHNHNIAADAERLCPRGHNWNPQAFKIISIAPITVNESGPVHLLAITNTGLRLYFTTSRVHDETMVLVRKR